MHALVLAAELECALIDADDSAATHATSLTDAVVSGNRQVVAESLMRLKQKELPQILDLKTPEGFAFYALDLFSYGKRIREISLGRPIAIVAIRSAGIAMAAACAGMDSTRISVRPAGHPYDREVHLDQEQRAWVAQALRGGREFFVVDEGPGLSGSSFLATAEALEAAGVPLTRLHLVGSHRCDPFRLVARDAASRWSRFDFHGAESSHAPADVISFRNRDWHVEAIPDANAWPPVWMQLTPPNYRSRDRGLFWKFEGLGSLGEAAAKRAAILAAAGWSPQIGDAKDGFNGYETVAGAVMSKEDLSVEVLDRIADYCAFRQSSLPASSVDSRELEEMTMHNIRQLTGIRLRDFELAIRRPTLCDARMAPHEWLRFGDEKIWKTDGVSHGDNHFFPGPCDIAWDLAGAIVEWEMNAEAAKRFLSKYEAASNDQVRERLGNHMTAYLAFQASYARMAEIQVGCAQEKARFATAAGRYEHALRQHLEVEIQTQSAVA